MSEEDKSYTSVLLPGSRVMLFTRDSETKSTFEAIAQDWRYTRVALEVHEGDADTAIQLFRGHTSPDLVIVQTDTIDDSFSQKLEDLAGSCAEGTAAIVIGPVNDVNLYRKFVGMGVSDYLVRPVDGAHLSDNIAATLIKKIGAAGSRLIAVMGAKGGVGATALAEALAWGTSEMLNQKTFLMDGAGGWSSLSVGMNFEPATTIAEAVRAAADNNKDSLHRMIFTASDKLKVLSSGGDVMLDDMPPASSYEGLLDLMMVTNPVVIVDLSSSPADIRRTVLARAHKIMLVTVPTLPSVRATRSLIHEIKDIRGGSDDAVDVIVNMVGLSPRHEVSKSQIEHGLERKPALAIPVNHDLFISAESSAKKLSDDKTGKEIVALLMPLARKVLAGTSSDSMDTAGNDDTDKKGGLGQILSKLKSKA